jgi:hypothetical protein
LILLITSLSIKSEWLTWKRQYTYELPGFPVFYRLSYLSQRVAYFDCHAQTLDLNFPAIYRKNWRASYNFTFELSISRITTGRWTYNNPQYLSPHTLKSIVSYEETQSGKTIHKCQQLKRTLLLRQSSSDSTQIVCLVYSVEAWIINAWRAYEGQYFESAVL